MFRGYVCNVTLRGPRNVKESWQFHVQSSATLLSADPNADTTFKQNASGANFLSEFSGAGMGEQGFKFSVAGFAKNGVHLDAPVNYYSACDKDRGPSTLHL